MRKQKTKHSEVLKKEKIREKLYDMIYSLQVDRSQCYCYDANDCSSSCYAVKGLSELYDKIVKMLEDGGVDLDKEV